MFLPSVESLLFLLLQFFLFLHLLLLLLLEDLESVLEHLEVEDVDVFVFQDPLSSFHSDFIYFLDNHRSAQRLLRVFIQPVVHLLLDLLGVELQVLAHLLVEEREPLELLHSQLHLLLVVSVVIEGHCIIIFVLHDIQYFALLRILQVRLLFLLLFGVDCSLLVFLQQALSVPPDLLL